MFSLMKNTNQSKIESPFIQAKREEFKLLKHQLTEVVAALPNAEKKVAQTQEAYENLQQAMRIHGVEGVYNAEQMAQRTAKEQPWIEAKARLNTLSHDRDQLNARMSALDQILNAGQNLALARAEVIAAAKRADELNTQRQRAEALIPKLSDRTVALEKEIEALTQEASRACIASGEPLVMPADLVGLDRELRLTLVTLGDCRARAEELQQEWSEADKAVFDARKKYKLRAAQMAKVDLMEQLHENPILALFARVSAATGATSLIGRESDALFVIPEASVQQARSELEAELV